MTDELQAARSEIDRIDCAMAQLFTERFAAVNKVASYKAAHGLPVLDEAREAEVLARSGARIADPALREYYVEFIRSVMASSRRYQTRRLFGQSVGYQGVEGAFSHLAAQHLFERGQLHSYADFEAVFAAVESGEIEVGVLPFENSTTGEVGEVLDLLYTHENCFISGFYDMEIRQNLLGVPGAALAEIKQVYSHPQALHQSAEYLRDRGWEIIPYPNTAKAAEYVSRTADKSKAAVASAQTAALYDLSILAQDINTSAVNTTRFILLTRNRAQSGKRFSLLFTVDHDAGSLARALAVIGTHGFNMECLRSRAMKNLPWQYYFYVEIDGSLADADAAAMLSELSCCCKTLRALGCYTAVQ